MSQSDQAVADCFRASDSDSDDSDVAGERFTPLCVRRQRKASRAKKRRRSNEALSAICFPGWN
jgi:hypothetical protein